MSHDGGTRLGALKARHGQKSIGAFQAHYGPNFAKGCGDEETLRDVLHKLDEPTLTKLADGHENGELETIRSDP